MDQTFTWEEAFDACFIYKYPLLRKNTLDPLIPDEIYPVSSGT